MRQRSYSSSRRFVDEVSFMSFSTKKVKRRELRFRVCFPPKFVTTAE